MYILTENNIPIDLNKIPISKLQNLSINFCVFDISSEYNNDYYFYPLQHILTFNSSTYILNIKGGFIPIPNCYKILIGEPYNETLEFVDIEECMHRDFEIFHFNPLKGYKPNFYKLEIISILPDQKWYIPKIKNDHLLVSPNSKEKNSECFYLVNNSSKFDTIDISMLL